MGLGCKRLCLEQQFAVVHNNNGILPHVTVSQGFWGPRSSSSFSCTCICITNQFFSLADTAASASALLLQRHPARLAGTPYVTHLATT
jgi:hypothetical protein